MPAAEAAQRLAGALDSLAGEGGTALDRAEAALVPGLKTMLERLRAILSPRPVDMNAIPADLKADWLAGRRARVQVFVRGVNDRPTSGVSPRLCVRSRPGAP
jgi:hypothetical protein